jgi:hypothetical protein
MSAFPHIPAGKREVRNFGWLFAGVGAVIGAYLAWKGSATWVWAVGGGVCFLGAGLIAYPILKPVYVLWMKFAFVLGWANTRLILGLFFYLILTPIGLIMRMTGKDPLSRRLDRSAATYWVRREPETLDPRRYENLF